MSTRIVEGRKAPDFTLHDAGGARVSLSDFAGRDVVVYFYPKDDTPGCTREACGFRDRWHDFQKAGIVVLGVSPDDAVSHAKFAVKYGLPFRLLSDPERTVMTAWGAYGDKVLYGKKTKGVIRSTVWIGPDGVVRKRWARVADAARHPAEVLEQITGTARGSAEARSERTPVRTSSRRTKRAR
ncbi:MAG TPA: peroxiredoxin [Candidatus Tectomicrobia bacterium]|nr:peroxiredoxin [Candidatus Tectomicrobia bacterium]